MTSDREAALRYMFSLDKPRRRPGPKPKSGPKPEPAKPAKPGRRKPLPIAGDTAGTCNRSPCGPYDPKLSLEEIDEARKFVAAHAGQKLRRKVVMAYDKAGNPTPSGTWRKEGKRNTWVPKYAGTSRVHRPLPASPLVVAYGLGLDSTAILVGLVQEHRKTPKGGWRPEAITFADTGAEKQVTYDFLTRMNAYLRENDFPAVTVVAYRTAFTKNGWGSAETLEQQVLVNQSGPSITEHFGRQSKCSTLWKQAPQDLWLKEKSGLFERHQSGRRAAYRPKHGMIVKAIGYDSTEERRMAPDGGGTGATFRAGHGDGFYYWHPLIEWGWDRARCRAEVEHELGAAPPKSSCFFCFAMKPEEIVSLSRDEAKRAAFMELVRRHGRQAYRFKVKVKAGLASDAPSRGVKGLAGKWSWTDLFVHGAEKALEGIYSPERRARLDAMVRQFHGRPTVLTEREVAELDRLAQELVRRSADRGRSIQAEALVAMGKEPTKSNMVDTAFKGQFDLSLDSWVKKLPAWSDVKGFRGTKLVDYQRNPAAGRSRFTSDTLEAPADLYGIAYPLL